MPPSAGLIVASEMPCDRGFLLDALQPGRKIAAAAAAAAAGPADAGKAQEQPQEPMMCMSTSPRFARTDQQTAHSPPI